MPRGERRQAHEEQKPVREQRLVRPQKRVREQLPVHLQKRVREPQRVREQNLHRCPPDHATSPGLVHPSSHHRRASARWQRRQPEQRLQVAQEKVAVSYLKCSAVKCSQSTNISPLFSSIKRECR